MTCERAQRLLALQSGGDLPGGRERKVAAHLEGCEACRSFSGELEQSAAWIREAAPPSVSEASYAEMRREVWRRIESGQANAGARRIGRIAWAAATVATAALAAFLLAPKAPRESAVPSSRPGDMASLPTRAAAPVVSPAPEAAPASAAEASPAAVRVAAGHPQRPLRRRPSAPAAESAVDRIEFRTANPNVRIIWLVRKGEEKSSSRAAGRIEEVS